MACRAVLLLAILLPLLAPTHACTCLPPSLCRTFFDPSVVNYVRAKVIAKTIVPSGFISSIKYTLAVQQNFKGCPPKSPVMVFTPSQSAACGVFLTVGVSYAIPLRAGPRPMISSCDFIREFDSLSRDDAAFLQTRTVCCKGVCKCASGKPMVNCFRQPCSPPETPPCKEATVCVDNYCGGCLAEWFTDKKQPACKPALF